MKGLALIIGPKPKGKAKAPTAPSSPYKSEEPEEPEAESDGPEQGYGTVLARMAGIADEDREDFVDALKGFVRSCVRKERDGGY